MKLLFNVENKQTLKDFMSFDDFMNEELYFEINEYDYYLHFFRGSEVLYIEDITNAGRVGKTCRKIVIYANETTKDLTLRLYNQNFEDVWAELVLEQTKNNVTRIEEEKAIDVFNPFTIKETYKPLKEAPKKWTLKHALRAIVQLQYTDLKCDGQYTDDYAFDNAVDFQRGEINEKADFIRKIIEHKSGWRVYQDWTNVNRIHLNCYSFDTNSFIFKVA